MTPVIANAARLLEEQAAKTRESCEGNNGRLWACGECAGRDCPARNEYEELVQAAAALRRLEYVLDRSTILKAVDDEPELPDEMPKEMWHQLCEFVYQGDRAGMTEAFRIAARLTKSEIRARLERCISKERT